MLNLDMTLLSIGRTPDNGLALPDQHIAIRHAEVRLLDDRFVITDLGNGDTYIAGRKLVPFQPQVLEEGTLIQIGPYVLAYLTGGAEDLQPELPELPELPREFTRLPLPAVRPTTPPMLLQKPASTYLGFLPSLFGESEFLGRYLLVFESIWEPIQQRQDFLHMYFHAGTAPVSMLAWLAEWLSIDFDPYWPEQRKRLWLKEAMQLIRWRGTKYGLRRAIEIGCGVTPYFEENPAKPYTLTVVLPDPETAQLEDLTREQALELIKRHMPAHVLYTVKFVDPPSPESQVPEAPSGT